MDNTKVINALGDHIQCKLRIFSGYYLQYYLGGAEAEFDILVSGNKGAGRVNLKLQKREDVWTITTAKLYQDYGDDFVILLNTEFNQTSKMRLKSNL